jgi:ribosomal protein S6--L-glutamate ligase
MKIGVLSRNQTLYSTRRLLEAGRARGHVMLVIDTLGIVVEMGMGHADMGHADMGHADMGHADMGHTNMGQNDHDPSMKKVSGQPLVGGLVYPFVRLPQVEAIIPRIGASITDYGVAVVRQFEAAAVPTTASAEGIASSRDKLASLQLMSRAGLPVPRTAVLSQPRIFFSAVQAVGGPPVIIKLSQGTQGRGVILAPNYRTVEAVLHRLRRLNQPLLAQEFVAEAEGKDVRVIVVGDRCVAAMERIASDGEYRSNLHRGGTAVARQISPEIAQLARQAVQAHGLAVAGVDIIQSRRGPLLLEVNSSPGLEGIEQATQVDVATAIIKQLEKQLA